ncbi:hypothetical protein Slin15195_G027110 [Septoria linicola]|uniref:YMC020W-like alpha/beta hydrolase domain-containing protein n=1 Tax=Septoria linicola TaxID=215465 RepID=A0A9Q9ANU1_9PEZI|nr:hypothetical protein Slin15195_G027110 [Septoria linicola]
MAPERKRSKLSSDNETEPTPVDDVQSAPNTTGEQHGAKQQPAPINTAGIGEATATVAGGSSSSGGSTSAKPSPQAPLPSNNRASWYSAASWKSKASPTAQVARKSISVDKGVSSESSTREEGGRRPSHNVSKSFKGGSRKSVPLVAEATRVYAVPDPASVPKSRKSLVVDEKVKANEKVPEKALPVETGPVVEEAAPLPPEPESVAAENDAQAETASMRPASGSWFGWWSRPDEPINEGDVPKSTTKTALDDMTVAQASDTPLPETPNLPAKASTDATQRSTGLDIPAGDVPPETSADTRYGSARSWFGLWSKAQKVQAEEEERQREADQKQGQDTADETGEPSSVQPEVQVSAEPQSTPGHSKAADTTNAPNVAKGADTIKAQDDADRPKSAGWAFWSKDKPKGTSKSSDDETQKQVGELAVADTPSQSHPEAAQFNEQHDSKTGVKRKGSLLRRGRKQKLSDVSGETTAAATPTESQAQTPACFTPNDTPEGSPAPVQRGKLKQTRPNLILPTFRDTYPTLQGLGYLDRLTQYIGSSLHLTPLPKPAQHPHILSQPPKVRKAIAIGVHGFFPAALLQRVLGQPTGTSIRFANYAAASIKKWCVDHQPDIKDVEVEKVALEGEGLVSDRVDTLWKLLLNWLSQLRQADFVMVACHSQGVPVATMLVAKLLQLGCLSPDARVGICALAGINLGPFLEYKSRFFGGSALELFDFSDRTSKVSVAYADALDTCLRHGVRITFIGGLDDQLVSLESSLFTPLNHPYVNRAIFVDGQLHTSNFLIHLVIFAAKLRNLGVSDHGLLREISAPLAGSIVGGAGHSRVYDDPAVYRTAIEFALESSDVSAAAFQGSRKASADETRKSMEEAASRRGSCASYPANMVAANHMRRGSLGSSSLAPPGTAPMWSPYEPAPLTGAAEKNPFVLPWAVRGMLEEELVKSDAKLQLEVKELVQEFEEWKPTSKVLKDVRWRLEGVRSML